MDDDGPLPPNGTAVVREGRRINRANVFFYQAADLPFDGQVSRYGCWPACSPFESVYLLAQ